MSKDLSSYRKSYEKEELLEANCPENPMELFQKWFHNADASETVEETNAMTVSTIGEDGYPKSRVVLLKKFTREGFIFYTNYTSEKGKAILANNNVCISFFWPALEQQIIIKGKAKKIAENLSDGYFESRPNGSKLGAWASDQSEVVSSREELENNLKSFEEQFSGKEIPSLQPLCPNMGFSSCNSEILSLISFDAKFKDLATSSISFSAFGKNSCKGGSSNLTVTGKPDIILKIFLKSFFW